MPDVVAIKRALISVSDKTGLIELATALTAAGIQLGVNRLHCQTNRVCWYGRQRSQ